MKRGPLPDSNKIWKPRSLAIHRKRFFLRAISLLTVLSLLVFTVSCEKNRENKNEANAQTYSLPLDPADVYTRKNYDSLYDAIGKNILYTDVSIVSSGVATVCVGGVTYELGLDFLSMAMIYNCQPCGGLSTEEQVFERWADLYMKRWQLLSPEILIYTEENYHLYRSTLHGYDPTAFFGVTDAVLSATCDSSTLRLGSEEVPTGNFRRSIGAAVSNQTDRDVISLTTGYRLRVTDREGNRIWNSAVLENEPGVTRSIYGKLTFSFALRSDLFFSDGTAIDASHYLVSLLAGSTPQAETYGFGGRGEVVDGYDEFVNACSSSEEALFSGLVLTDPYHFSVTLNAAYSDSYYAEEYLDLCPEPLELWGVSGLTVVREVETGILGLSANYSETFDNVVGKDAWNSGLPFSGPYVVSDWTGNCLTLTANPYYLGDDLRPTPSIPTILYRVCSEGTLMMMFQAGEVDILSGLSKSEIETRNNADECKTVCIGGGYGFLQTNCKRGAVSFASVRNAVKYSMNRPAIASALTSEGKCPSVPILAFSDDVKEVNPFSLEKAVSALKNDFWIYNEKGGAFTQGVDDVRYRKLTATERTENNLNYVSPDGNYRTLHIGDDYYLPLCLTVNSGKGEASSALQDLWIQTEIPSLLGMKIYLSEENADLTFRRAHYFSLQYDAAFLWSVSPEFSEYNRCHLHDSADFAVKE